MHRRATRRSNAPSALTAKPVAAPPMRELSPPWRLPVVQWPKKARVVHAADLMIKHVGQALFRQFVVTATLPQRQHVLCKW
jgi:hypothetical protein